jgi:hypothetical protein
VAKKKIEKNSDEKDVTFSKSTNSKNNGTWRFFTYKPNITAFAVKGT